MFPLVALSLLPAFSGIVAFSAAGVYISVEDAKLTEKIREKILKLDLKKRFKSLKGLDGERVRQTSSGPNMFFNDKEL